MTTLEMHDRLKEAPLRMVAARIKKARREATLTLDALAEIVGTSRQHLISLEQSKHRPRLRTLARIAEATGKPLEFFLDADAVDNPFPADEAAA